VLIERSIEHYVVDSGATVEEALRRITQNKHRAVFCVDAGGRLLGVLSDGDFRRWTVEHPDSPLTTPVMEIANRDPVKERDGVEGGRISGHFSEAISLVAIVDARDRLVAVARPKARDFWLGNRRVGDDAPAVIVAEIGINHNGSLGVAKQLVDIAIASGADVAKFQMRDMTTLYRNDGRAGDLREDLGPQYTMDLLDRFSLTVEELIAAFDYCHEGGIVPLCTAWDVASARVLDDYGIPGFKIASADLTNHELLAFLAATGRPLVMSTGMSREDEIAESVKVLRSGHSPYSLLHCNSTYPTPFRDVNLRYLSRLAEIGDCVVGYSGHERGFHVPIAALSFGAKIIEKHLTLDREWEGNDHKVSLLPSEFATMVGQIREVEEALGEASARRITQGELMNRVNLAKSLVARVKVTPGECITGEMIDVRSPGQGLQPNRQSDLIGCIAKRSMEPGDFFFESDLFEDGVSPRAYKFNRPWGLAVRYHDYRVLSELSNPDFIEFHMSYRDLEVDVEAMVPESMEMGLVVHSPDLFRGDHILNLASEDDETWRRSIAELQRVVETARQLSSKFRNDAPTRIVASLGGFTRNAPVAPNEIPRMYDRVASGLSKLDTEGVEILPQTLPPFPWYLGGQLYCNLFVGPEDTAAFAQEQEMRICLDIAHTKLACNHREVSFVDATEILAPLAGHLHIVDAAGLDSEGLQIGEGEVDFSVLGRQLTELAPGVSFIPEIWQGHGNTGEGFWLALHRLETYL